MKLAEVKSLTVCYVQSQQQCLATKDVLSAICRNHTDHLSMTCMWQFDSSLW